jgi:perosamine synthetase
MPTFTMIAVYNAALHLGATPVLCDSCPETWNIDVGAAAALVTSRTRAIVAVHTYGLPCNMDELESLAGGASAALVEDAAEAHGAVYRGKRAGSLGDVGCFSFFANKIITCGEGGMVVTSDAKLAERARSLRDLGKAPGQRYLYADAGYGYRMPSASAALGLSQLSRVATLGARRTRNADLYRAALGEVAGLTFAPRLGDRTGSDWMVGVLIGPEYGMDRDALAAYLAAAGVETRPFFLPAHRQPFHEGGGEFPVADRLGDQGILLPSGSSLTDVDIQLVSNLIKGATNA